MKCLIVCIIISAVQKNFDHTQFDFICAFNVIIVFAFTSERLHTCQIRYFEILFAKLARNCETVGTYCKIRS